MTSRQEFGMPSRMQNPDMSDQTLNVFAVIGSNRKKSITRTAITELKAQLEKLDCSVDLLDLRDDPLPLFNPDKAFAGDSYAAIKERVLKAEAFVLGNPDYHGSISSPLKNFLDHFWKEFAGKLFATIVASHEKGLTATDHLRTVARQCYAWCLPYGLSLMEKTDATSEVIDSDALRNRLEMMAHDISTYGRLLSRQRRADLAAKNPGFLKVYRK